MAVSGKIYLKDNSGNINEFTVPVTDTNAVHKSGNENIADTKTFTGTIVTANNASLRRNDSTGFLQLGFTTVLNGGRLNLFGKDYTADPGSFALMTGDGTNAKTLKGTTAGVLSWDGSITATGFTGPLTGNATSATKATQDSDGNAINTTYLKLSGGTMTGNVAWNKTATIGGESKAHNAGLSLNANSLDFGVYDWTNSKWAWKITQAGVASFYGNADTATKATQDGNGAVIANTYLKLTGGTLTGPLNIFTDQAYAVGTANALVGVRYKNAAGDVNYAGNVLDVIGTDGTDGYNIPISFGSSSGTTHIGAGESRRGFLGARALYNNESLYLTADGSVNIYTNCANDNATYAGPVSFSGTASATGGRINVTGLDKINANNIELNGASNNGGYIDFHFNNSTADYTSRIIESTSGYLSLNQSPATSDNTTKIATTAYVKSNLASYLPLSGGTMTNKISFANNVNPLIECTWTDVDVTATSRTSAANKMLATILDKNGIRFAAIECTQNTDGSRDMHYTMRNRGNSGWINDFSLKEDNAGNASVVLGHAAYAPTPGSSDNSTRIATTAFVRAATGNFACNAATATTATRAANLNRFVGIQGNTLTKGTYTSSGTSYNGELIFTDSTNNTNSVNRMAAIQSYVGTELNIMEMSVYQNTNNTNNAREFRLIHHKTDGFYSTIQANFLPRSNNTFTLGRDGLRWKQLFANTATISTSDERLKDEITSISDDVLDAWNDISWKNFKFKDAILEKGNDARKHTGIIAQDIDRIFKKHNINASKYGFFCYDSWDARQDEQDNDGKVILEGREAGDIYSVRYEEALCLEAAYQRRRAERAEARISELETKVNLLKEQMISILEKLS